MTRSRRDNPRLAVGEGERVVSSEKVRHSALVKAAAAVRGGTRSSVALLRGFSEHFRHSSTDTEGLATSKTGGQVHLVA